MKRILFVCHGNICRSPMAEYIMKRLAADRGLHDRIYAESAATSTEETGNPVYPPARRMLSRHGIDCSGHAARQVRTADYSRFDLIVCMDRNNLRLLSRIIPSDPDGKIHLLMDYTSRPDSEVADPWYTGDFEATWRDCLDGCLGILWEFSLQ